MIVVQGGYENGRIELAEDAPMEKADVIVIFPEKQTLKKRKNRDCAKELFDEFTGCITRVIDEKIER